MGKKSKKSGGGGGEDSATKHEQKLQGVLLADPFMNTFQPLSYDRCKVLCPLNNVALIDYAMDFLAGSGVEELYVFVTNNEVETHVQEHTAWGSYSYDDNKPMKVIVIKDTSVTNAGDALRELDKQNVIQSDPFVLMFGDVITNVDIKSALVTHKERHKKDSSAIMTLLLKQVGSWNTVTTMTTTAKATTTGKGAAAAAAAAATATTTATTPTTTTTTTGKQEQEQEEEKKEDKDEESTERITTITTVTGYSSVRSCHDDLIIGLDPSQSNRIVLYDNKCQQNSISVPCSFFMTHPSIDIRCDLVDCGVYICSPDVLARFSDEFDYRDICQEFISNSCAEEEEGLQNKIFAEFCGGAEYAVRVQDFRTYSNISKDILRRWCYPIVPDNLPSGYEKQYRYQLQRHYVYRERKQNRTKIGRSSIIHGPGMIGSYCFIGEGCSLEGSIIGNHCHIGNNVTLKDCILWDGVCIEDGVQASESILANECLIKSGADISKGCVIGEGCIIGENIALPEFTRLTMISEDMAKEQDGVNYDFDDFDDDYDDVEDNDNNNDDDDADAGANADGEEEEESKKEEEDKNNMEEDGPQIKSDHDVVGPDGRGRVWLPSPDDEDDFSDDDDDTNTQNTAILEIVKSQSLGYDPTQLYLERSKSQKDSTDDYSEDGEDNDNDNDDHAALGLNSHDYASITFGNESGGRGGRGGQFAQPDIIGRQKGVDVIKELKMMCLEFEPSSPIENLGIELNSYKFSQNATYSDCTTATMYAIIEMMNITSGMSDGKLITSLKNFLEKWSPLIQKMSIGMNEEKAMLYALETVTTNTYHDSSISSTIIKNSKEVSQRLSRGPSFRFFLQTLHEEEILNEEAILSWASERELEIIIINNNNDESNSSSSSPRIQLFQLQHVQDFLEWLKEDDEDEEDDNDDEDDSDEDESDEEE